MRNGLRSRINCAPAHRTAEWPVLAETDIGQWV
jgi:hypothetical protein